MMDGGIGFTHGAGGIFGLLFWIILIVVIVAAVRWLMNANGNQSGRSNTALDILDQRYARDEIDQQEYEQKRREISQKDN